MSPKWLIILVGLAMLPLFGAASPTPSLAQTAQPSGAHAPAARRAHTRIEINPRPLLYRRCVDWYVLQYRPSGTVLYPQYHCWWVRG
ncbi:MAG TPA: hypothetical protein VK430_08700 [Xanthobacteraceae bacterium]|nr:hypothetical protein [Xanthobacteraceae bacterium]